MAWSGSAVYTLRVSDIAVAVNARNIWSDAMLASMRFALYDNTATPNRHAPLNSDGYGQGGFPASAEVTGTGWTAAGHPPDSIRTEKSPLGGFAIYAPSLTRPGVTFTRQIYGAFMYSNFGAGGNGRGQAYFYFGGPVNGPAGGTFTVRWAWPPGTLCIGRT